MEGGALPLLRVEAHSLLTHQLVFHGADCHLVLPQGVAASYRFHEGGRAVVSLQQEGCSTSSGGGGSGAGGMAGEELARLIGYVGRPACRVVRLQPAGGLPTRSCESPHLACSLWVPAVAFKPRTIVSMADPFVSGPLQPAQQAASRLLTSA